MSAEIIELNGKKYIAVDSEEGQKLSAAANGGIRIVVLQRGWVLIGRYYRKENTTTATLLDASVIRRWGTSEGLPELALKGRLSGTVLDKCGKNPVRFDVLTEVFNMEVDESKWKEL